MRNTLGALGLSMLCLVACAAQQPVAAPLSPPPAAEPAAAAPLQPEPTVEPPKAPELTAEQKVKFYQDCWALFNAHDLAKFADCYADNAIAEAVDSGVPTMMGKNAIIEQRVKPFFTAFPDATGENVLTLQNGNAILSVTLIKGTHKGPLVGAKGEIPATNKKVAMQMVNLVELQNGKCVKQWEFADERTLLGQLGVVPGPVRKVAEQAGAEKPVVLATGSDVEKANVEAYKKVADAFNKHDAAALEPLLADDVVISNQWELADRAGKKEAIKGSKETWKAFSDAKIVHTSIWSAGDYVVATGNFSGTNDGAFPAAKVWTKTGKPVNVQSLEIAKLEGGKIKKQWLFTNGMAFAAQLGTLPPEKKAKPAPAVSAAKPASAASPAKSGATAAAAPAAPTAPATKAPASATKAAASGPAKAAAQGTPAAGSEPATPPAAPVKPVPAAPAKPAPATPPATPAPAAPAPASPPPAK